MLNRRSSKMKVGWISACLGIGGADGYMLGLCRYARNIDWTGIAIQAQVSVPNLEWAERMTGKSVNFHQVDHHSYQLPGISYHNCLANAVYEVAREADILVTWGVPKLREHIQVLDLPIVEIAQNCDDYARQVIASNEDIVDYRVAVSQSCVPAFGSRGADAVIYNAIDPGRVTPYYGRATRRHLWGLTDEHKVLLFSGRLVDEKCPAAMIQALSRLPDNWVGLIVGSGYQEQQLIEEAQRYIDNPGRLFFMQPEYHVGDILAACDVFMLPSDFEGHPLALCEAWLAGIPTVTSDNLIMRELREQFGSLSNYVPCRPKTNELVEAILKACDGSPESQEIVARARGTTWAEWTLTTAAAQWEEFLQAKLTHWRHRRMRGTLHACEAAKPQQDSRSVITTIKTRDVGDHWNA